MQDSKSQLIQDVVKDCKTIEDIQNILKDLFKDFLQGALEAEMTHHLGYQKHSSEGDNTGNSRNGYSTKTVKTRLGKTEISIPRDRNGEFEPQVIKKYDKNASELENQIIAMYAKGISTRDIEDQMRDLYGIDVSAGLVSKVTDRVMPIITEWQARPLDKVYPIVFLDAIHFKVKQDSRIINKAAYTVLGINTAGYKDILGIWIGEHESSSFWLGVCNDLKSRGVEDILIVCKDGLTGFSEAISAVFPQTDIQLCIVHQIRNSLKYVPYKDRKPLVADLKTVYQALTIEQAELAFDAFKEKWGKKYPMVIKSWEKNWLELTTYFSYPRDIRRLIYTTNTVEGFHRQLRKVTKTKTAFPTDDALRKILYLATTDITKKWTMPVRDWANCVSQFALLFGDRMVIDDLPTYV
jgi:putative transposase